MIEKIFNDKASKISRRELRQQDIACEKIIWYKLRNRGLLNFKFRRQFGIGVFVADFYCPELKLVIEIDGATHATAAEIAYDKNREEYFIGLGLIVKRYTNTDVKLHLSDLLYDLANLCERLQENKPHPNPLLRKERGY